MESVQLNLRIAAAKQREQLDEAARRRGLRGWFDRRERGTAASPIHWQPLTMRLATSADAPALERLAALDEKPAPAEPVLVGVLMAKPVAALSLADGHVVADPFAPTGELVELMRLRARQLQRAA